MTYASLTEHVSSAASGTEALGSVQGVAVLGDGVYFAAHGRMLRWRDGEGFRSWPVAGSPRLSRIGDTLYVHDTERGLLRLDGDELRPVSGSDVFAGADKGAQVLAGPPREVVVTESGLWRRNGDRFVPLATPADDYLRQSGILPWVSRSLPDGRLAIATHRGGLVILRPDGSVDGIVDEAAGLPDATVYSVFGDRYGGIWVGTEGIVRVAPGPLSLFDGRLGLEGVVLNAARDSGGRLHAATSRGLYQLIPSASPAHPARFEELGGPGEACIDLLNTSEGLLAACTGGVYLVEDEATHLVQSGGAYALGQGGDGRLWVGTWGGGLFVLTPDGGAWAAVPVAEGIKGGILAVYVETDNTVWLGTGAGEAVRVRPGRLEGEAPEITHYGVADGLVGTNWVKVWGLGGRPAFGTKTGLYRFRDGAAPAFAIDENVGEALVAAARSFPNVFLLAAGPGGDVWYFGGDDLAVARNRPEGWEIDRAPLQHLRGHGSHYALAVEADGTAWLGGTQGLFRRAPAPSVDLASYRALVRRVSTVGADSVLAASHLLTSIDTPLGPGTNALRFEYAAPSYTWRLRFRYRLPPLDVEWSPWTEATAKEYTNLPPGRYTFEVQAEDGRMVLSSVGAFSFEIAPPWYGTAWARSLWALLALGALGALVSGSARWRTRRLRDQAQVLEETVILRTAEVEHQKAQLAAQADQLAAQADQLRALDEVKSRFFANVSHEFRTPLTLTIGPLDDLKDGLYGPLPSPVAEQVDLARRSAGRVLDLINQILDVARLEAGRMELRARRLDLSAFISDIAQAFVPLAERKGIILDLQGPENDGEVDTTVWADPEHLQKVYSNLLSNALKFTPEGGAVQVLIAADSHSVRISVRDSGPGIPAADLPHVFERFYRVDESAGRLQPGTGIGLALVKELVELHGGTIEVESEEGFGSRFTITFRRGRDHLRAEDVVEDGGGEPPIVLPLVSVVDPVPSGDGASEIELEDAGDEDVTTVLVVDDSAEIRAYVRRHLEGKVGGYRVVEAADGTEGLAKARALLPDLVLSDVMMPGMDGFALCRALKADPETDFIPVVLLTARAEAEDRLEGLGEHADDYLTKPFDVRELRARVDNLIESRRRLRQRFAAGAAWPGSDGDGGLHAARMEVDSAETIFLERVREHVEANLGDEDFSVEHLADAVGVSRGHLHRQLKALAGQTPSVAIRTMRLERASQLLAARAGTVSEVAYAVGYKSVAHFSNSFEKDFGCRPSVYSPEG
jgi:signal transduction histidine kinase/DNA-binding response OmpR family regulator